MTETVSSGDPLVSFVSMSYVVPTRGSVVTGNGTYIALVDRCMNAAGQLIFTRVQPTVTQSSEGSLEILCNLRAQSEAEINFYVSVFECPSLGSSSADEASLDELFINNTKSYRDKVAEFPLDIFDYRQAITNLNASYIVIRSAVQFPRFEKDPMFSLLFANKEVVMFQIHKLDSPRRLGR
ncbi:MAG: hypothetical protein ACE14S_10105 [Candidatus Bathyarchaeia archaeon]